MGLIFHLIFCLSMTSAIFSDSLHVNVSDENSRTVVDFKGNPESVVWVVQLSDLHFSVHHPDRAIDFKRLIGPTLAMIKPSLVLITGDLTDGKSKDLLKMNQDEAEWKEYQNVMDDVVKKSGLDKKFFYDLRGNHDNFGVPVVGGQFDFFSKYSINGGLGRRGNVNSITLESGERKHLFVGFDSTMAMGPRGPTNLFGHPTEELLADIDYELSQWDSQVTKPVTKIAFGHFPISFTAVTESGKTLREIFLKHSLSTYLCGHLHTRFGKKLKRYHQSGHHFISSERYFQLNIQQTPIDTSDSKSCHKKTQPTNGFWEWEMGDWRKSRVMRILAIDAGHISFTDIDFESDAKMTIILPTFPLDSRFISANSYHQDYSCNSVDSSSYKNVRALIFSKSVIVSVVAKIFDSRPGNLNLIMEATMRNIENSTTGDLYSAPWNWKAFEDPSPDRFWLQIEATDIMGRSSISELRPFSVNGVGMKLQWTWKEFLVMGCQWANLYYPMFWVVLIILFFILLISRALLSCSKIQYSYKSFSYEKRFSSGLLWILTEFSSISSLWLATLLYLFHLIFLPWFWGQVFTASDERGYMTYKGWAFGTSGKSSKRAHIAHPDVMVVVLPHLCFVVLPAIFVTAALAVERTLYREHYLSKSGKKKDDNNQERQGQVEHSSPNDGRAKLFSRRRWVRNFLIVICLAIGWKHWQLCRAVTVAYEMNPFLHSPMYCLPIPLLMCYAIYKTMAV